MINLKEYENRDEVLQLLTECMYPDEIRIIQEYEQYLSNQSRVLLGIQADTGLIGLIGFIFLSKNSVELKHIAIKPKYRGQGQGKKLINECINQYNVISIEAETDKDAVNFYRKIGFEITTLGEKYPGVERFKCLLNYTMNKY